MRLLTRAIQVLVMWWLLFAGIVQAIPILDQQHLPQATGQSLTVANDRTQIQTFTVEVTGVLTRIDVRVAREPNTVEDMELSLWSTDVAGLPKDLLATVSVPPSAVPGPGFTQELTTFDLSAEAVAVSAGELLAILLNSNASNEPPFFQERYTWAFSGQYDGGTAYTRLGPSLFELGEDFHFRTYVDPGTIDETLPHFTCFSLAEKGRAINEDLTLITQFGKEAVEVKNPHFLCAPTIKKRFCKKDQDGKTECEEETKADLEGLHLLCWKIEPSGPPVKKEVTLDSQFGDTDVKVQTGQLLCEPVIKEIKKH